MRPTQKPPWNPLLRLAIYVLLVLGVLWLLGKLHGVLAILFMALAFAYLSGPVVQWLQAHRIPRILGVWLIYSALLVFLALASVLISQALSQFSQLGSGLPSRISTLFSALENLLLQIGNLQLPPLLKSLLDEAGTSLQSLAQGLLGSLMQALQTLLAPGGGLLGFMASLVGGVLQLLTALVISAYLLYDWPQVGSTILKTLPRPYQPSVSGMAQKLDYAVGNYLRGQLKVAALVGLVVGIGLNLVGIPLASALGLLAAVFNLIPYAGVVISSVPALLLAATLGWPQVGLTLGVIWLANQLEANLFSPLILSRATHLHPVVLITALLVGVSLAGLWGALFSVPVAVFLKLIYSDYYLNSRFYREGWEEVHAKDKAPQPSESLFKRR